MIIRIANHNTRITIEHSLIQSLSLTHFTLPSTCSLPIGRILSHTFVLPTLSHTPLHFTENSPSLPPPLNTNSPSLTPPHTHSTLGPRNQRKEGVRGSVLRLSRELFCEGCTAGTCCSGGCAWSISSVDDSAAVR
jgi:hypothetical protein